MKKSVCILCTFCLGWFVKAQNIGLKADVLRAVLTAPQLGAELTLTNRMTLALDVCAAYRPWGKQIHYLAVMPQLRYWLRGRTFANGFVGVKFMADQHDVTWSGTVYDGEMYAAGVTAGYDFYLSKHWSLDLSATAYAAYYHHRQYAVRDTYFPELTNQYTNGWLCLPDIGVSLVYIIK